MTDQCASLHRGGNRSYWCAERMYLSSVISRPHRACPRSRRTSTRWNLGSTRACKAAADRPAPVPHKPSTRTSLPPSASRPAQRSSAVDGSGSAQTTWRTSTTSNGPLTGGSAASPTTNVTSVSCLAALSLAASITGATGLLRSEHDPAQPAEPQGTPSRSQGRELWNGQARNRAAGLTTPPAHLHRAAHDQALRQNEPPRRPRTVPRLRPCAQG